MRDLVSDIQMLARQEIKLARVEVQASAGQARQGAALVGGAAVIGFIGLMLLAATIVLLLTLLLPSWAAALIVTIVFLALAGGLAWTGIRQLKKVNPKPEQTLATLKEDQEWLKQQMR